MFGFRTTQAGTEIKFVTWENVEDKSSSCANSLRFPTNKVVSSMESGRGTISYRSPPTIISKKSASRRLWTICNLVSLLFVEEEKVKDNDDEEGTKALQKEACSRKLPRSQRVFILFVIVK